MQCLISMLLVDTASDNHMCAAASSDGVFKHQCQRGLVVRNVRSMLHQRRNAFAEYEQGRVDANGLALSLPLCQRLFQLLASGQIHKMQCARDAHAW